jgi:hypothetical protein
MIATKNNEEKQSLYSSTEQKVYEIQLSIEARGARLMVG